MMIFSLPLAEECRAPSSLRLDHCGNPAAQVWCTPLAYLLILFDRGRLEDHFIHFQLKSLLVSTMVSNQLCSPPLGPFSLVDLSSKLLSAISLSPLYLTDSLQSLFPTFVVRKLRNCFSIKMVSVHDWRQGGSVQMRLLLKSMCKAHAQALLAEDPNFSEFYCSLLFLDSGSSPVKPRAEDWCSQALAQLNSSL